MHLTQLIFLFLITALNSAVAHAAANCHAYPKAEWAQEETLRSVMTEEGYRIKKLKIDGNCYEIYGYNPQGKKVEFYFDMKTLEIVKAEVEQ